MELFTILYKPNKIIYKGTNKNIYTKPFDIEPIWLGEINTAKKYGKYVHKFRTKKQLKLIDVTNGIFHNDFISKLNNLFKDQSASSEIKGMILLPFGLPNLDTQLRLKKLEKNILYNKDIIDQYIGYFNNKHRLSIDKYDQETVKIMKILYPSFDGYISENLWPSYFHDGFVLPELCIFNPSLSIEYLGLYNNIISDGHINNNSNINNIAKPKNKYNLHNNNNDKIPKDLIEFGYKSWDELTVVIPGKMEEKSKEYHEKLNKKINNLISKYGNK